jgi:hypothetical protein
VIAHPSLSEVPSSEKVSDTEMAGEAYEHLEGVFGLRMRVVWLQLGGEAEPTALRMRAAKAALVSPGVVSIVDRQLGFRRGFMVRDPVGHAQRIVER